MRRSLIGTGLCLALAASCAGRSTSDDGGESDRERRLGATGGTNGGSTPPTDGTTGGSTAVTGSGGTSTSVGGSTGLGGGSTHGGTAPTAGEASGSGAHAGKGPDVITLPEGGRSGAESTGGDAGAPQAGADPGTGEGGYAGERVTCTDQFGEESPGYRCVEGDAYAQGPTYELVPGATDISECLAACKARPDCAAVSSYLHVDKSLECLLSHDACDSPLEPSWAEEDGGLNFRKTCAGDTCTYEPLGHLQCEGVNLHLEILSGATSLADCMQACNADETCTAVVDYFYIDDVFRRCFLNIGTCKEMIRNFEDAHLYRRICD